MPSSSTSGQLPYNLSSHFQKQFWKLNLPTKLRMFLQLLYVEQLPVKEILYRQIQALNPHYAFCGEKKTIDHAFFSYPHAVSIYGYTRHFDSDRLYLLAATQWKSGKRYVTFCIKTTKVKVQFNSLVYSIVYFGRTEMKWFLGILLNLTLK